MEKSYALQALKWAMYKFYNDISCELAVYQLLEVDYKLDTQTDNIIAVRDFLLYTYRQPPQVIRTNPDVANEDNLNRNPRRGLIFKNSIGGKDLYVEVKHPRYNRSRAQLDFEDRIRAAGDYYMVIEGLADLIGQNNIREIDENNTVYDST